MPILTKPSVISKGETVATSLSKSLLAAHAFITDAFFQDSSKWASVSINYANSHGQSKALVFKAEDATPEAMLHVSLFARSDFEVQSITIYDVDGGKFSIPRSALNASEFDILFDVEENTSFFNRNFSSPSSLVSGETLEGDYTELTDGYLMLQTEAEGETFAQTSSYEATLPTAVENGVQYLIRIYREQIVGGNSAKMFGIKFGDDTNVAIVNEADYRNPAYGSSTSEYFEVEMTGVAGNLFVLLIGTPDTGMTPSRIEILVAPV